MNDPAGESNDATRRGVLLAIAAYGMWGLFPLFWKQLAGIPAREQLAHRIAWALVVYLAIAAVRGRGGAGLRDIVRALARPGTRRVLIATAGLIAVNWYTYVYAVEQGMILQASLGYFINPLVNVVLGMVFLSERLRPGQWVAVGLAAIGISIMTYQAGSAIWISLSLAGAFGVYGLLRKTADVDALSGAAAEALLLAPFCVAFIVVTELAGEGHFFASPKSTALLAATGLVTALPLLAFAGAARRIPLSTLGFIQYLAPTGQFLLAVWVYGEALQSAKLAAFCAIWAALLVFVVDGVRHARSARRARPAP